MCGKVLTHLFLSVDEINNIKQYVPQAIKDVSILVIAENKNGNPVGFMGVDDKRLEMLFVLDKYRGQGIGKQLLQYGIENYSINELTTRAKNENKEIQIEGDDEQQLICDLDWTSEAIGNIVKNALDHTQDGGIIRIIWERTPAMFRILISDNGTGIAPEDIHHIFKRFYRSKHSLDTQGIGLGLPLAKSIIEGQGGVIAVQSEIGNGTTFTLSFLTEL